MSEEELERSYNLGKFVGSITAWCEAARSEAKDMSLSSPFKPEEINVLLPKMKKIAEDQGVHYYLEKDLLTTDLFPNVDMSNRWVFIIYKKKIILDSYFTLKAEKENLVQMDKYVGEARKETARKMGRLLGYSGSYIEEKLLG